MISHDHKLFFIHIPKCGGRSVCNVFNQRFDHFTAFYYSMHYKHYWNKYERFSIVRNPYARLVSMYHYIQEHRRHSLEPIAYRSASGEMPTFTAWVEKNFTSMRHNFKHDSPEAERGTDGQLGSPFWFSPQANFLRSAGENGGITVFKLEHGMSKVDKYLKQRGVQTEGIPRLNTSKHSPYRDYYDHQLIDFLADYDFISSDRKAFGYGFNH